MKHRHALRLIVNLLWGLVVISTSWAEEPTPLNAIFNGHDLSGWQTPAENKWWSVDGEVLRCRSDPEQTGSILWTEKNYRDFVVELEFKFGPGTVDSGVFLRDEQEQIQIGISGSRKRDMTASPYISGKGYPVEAENVAEILKLDDWNLLRIEARGNTYQAWLNGQKVMIYESETARELGPIGLQLHPGREMAIDFRKIRAADLP